MRLGGPADTRDSETWIADLRRKGYAAADCPFDAKADASTQKAFLDAARKVDIVIAEVGVWNNPLHPDAAEARKAIEHCKVQLDLAERVGANCCVNISGSRGALWDGPHQDNFTPGTFALIVDTVREIIDAVRPTRSFYTLEPMPWMYPDSPESYLDLILAVDRPAFAVHMDPVNIISSPQRYFGNAAFIRECFRKLGPWIKSCHGKDTLLSEKLTVHLSEARAGVGVLDYGTYLHEIEKISPDMPLLLEHLSEERDYELAAAHVRGVAKQTGVVIKQPK